MAGLNPCNSALSAVCPKKTQQKKPLNNEFVVRRLGGAEGSRTLDLCIAKIRKNPAKTAKNIVNYQDCMRCDQHFKSLQNIPLFLEKHRYSATPKR